MCKKRTQYNHASVGSECIYDTWINYSTQILTQHSTWRLLSKQNAAKLIQVSKKKTLLAIEKLSSTLSY